MPSLNLDWLFLKIYNLFTKGIQIHVGPHNGLVNTIVFILSLIAVIFLAVTIYSVMRLKERNHENHKRYHEAIHAAGAHKHTKQDNKKWTTVIAHIKSTHSSDWRLAIIEADNMLDTLTQELGLVGADLGERLKYASVSHFKTLDAAWEAHKVRNKIAHEGLSFDLPYRDAKKAIEQYESVFREFNIL
jgi:hypothetical protein